MYQTALGFNHQLAWCVCLSESQESQEEIGYMCDIYMNSNRPWDHQCWIKTQFIEINLVDLTSFVSFFFFNFSNPNEYNFEFHIFGNRRNNAGQSCWLSSGAYSQNLRDFWTVPNWSMRLLVSIHICYMLTMWWMTSSPIAHSSGHFVSVESKSRFRWMLPSISIDCQMYCHFGCLQIFAHEPFSISFRDIFATKIIY